MEKQFLIAGFGGQGVLLIGQLIAKAAMRQGYEVSWMPSYGPEMRGGEANCAVVVSDEPIGSPLVSEPPVLVAMNKPSLIKFMPMMPAGGTVVEMSMTASAHWLGASAMAHCTMVYWPAMPFSFRNAATLLATAVDVAMPDPQASTIFFIAAPFLRGLCPRC